MTTINRVAIVAPDPLREAFAVVLQSASFIEMIASAINIETLKADMGDEIPDVILMYLAESSTHLKNTCDYGKIERIKEIWFDTACITITKDPNARQRIQALGADVVLFDGVSPTRLLKAIDDLCSGKSIEIHP
jgi:DNA-binding NarL/FixJ family response regulator